MTPTKRALPLDELIGRRLRTAVRQEPGGGAGFGRRLRRFIGKAWGRQTVYEASEGKRKFRVTDLVAIARATNQPIHYFLDAEAVGAQTVALDDGAEAVDAAELMNMFRIPQPREMSRDVSVALRLIDGVSDDLKAQQKELDDAKRLIDGSYWKDLERDLKSGKVK